MRGEHFSFDLGHDGYQEIYIFLLISKKETYLSDKMLWTQIIAKKAFQFLHVFCNNSVKVQFYTKVSLLFWYSQKITIFFIPMAYFIGKIVYLLFSVGNFHLHFRHRLLKISINAFCNFVLEYCKVQITTTGFWFG